MNSPTKITVSFTFDQLTELVNDVTGRREAERWNLHIPYEGSDTDGFVGDDGEVKGYSVRAAERSLEERARYARQLELLTGNLPVEKPEDVARVVDARKRFDAQERLAAAEQETEDA